MKKNLPTKIHQKIKQKIKRRNVFIKDDYVWYLKVKINIGVLHFQGLKFYCLSLFLKLHFILVGIKLHS